MTMIIPIYLLIIFIFAYISKINAYDSFIKGIKNGMMYVVQIFPFFFTMVFATRVFIESGIVKDFFSLIDLNFSYGNEILLQALFRPLSSNGSISVMFEVFEIYGVNSKQGLLSSVLQGSTDTTIYICSLYFGSIMVKNYKRAMYLGLVVDLIAFIGSVIIINIFV